jgi:hypothetical protein
MRKFIIALAALAGIATPVTSALAQDEAKDEAWRTEGVQKLEFTRFVASGKFTLDLLTEPYWVGSAQPTGIGGRISNWFADKSPPGPLPTGVAVVEGCEPIRSRVSWPGQIGAVRQSCLQQRGNWNGAMGESW